jgi:predicted ABC-type ATPase
MIKLSDLILERSDRPKAVIMAGGAGSGKTYLLNQLGLDSLPQFNPDKYVEDPDHPYYNKLGPAANQVAKDVAAASKERTNLVWDTTASGKRFENQLISMLDIGYDVYMVMVYTHPMVSYIANFQGRERNIPADAVFSTWRNIYQKIEDYNEKLKGNLSIFVSDRGGEFNKEIEAFNTSAKKGLSGVKEFLKDYNEKNNIGGSSFFKPVEMNKEEELEFTKHVGSVTWDKNNRSEDKAIKTAFLKTFRKNGVGPGQDKLEDALNKYRASSLKRREDADAVLDNILDMVYNPTFQEKLKHSSVGDIDSKVQSFLA